jgi:hypothetical protein
MEILRTPPLSPGIDAGRYTGPYQDYVSGLLDYVTYYGIVNGLAKPGQMSHLYNVLRRLPRYFRDVSLLGRFIENHDVVRFASLTADIGLRKSAYVFNMLGDGIPIVTPTSPCGERSEGDAGLLWTGNWVIRG